MSEPRIFGSSQGTLGDSMWLTPLLAAHPGSTLRMFDTPSCRGVATLYEGLVDHVEFVEQPGVPPTVDLPTHVSERMLIAAGRPDASIIPIIRLRDDEIAWARCFLVGAGFPDLMKLLVVHTHNSGWADPSNWFARHVKPPKALMQALADQWRARGSSSYVNHYQVLQFCNEPWPGKPDNFDPLTGTHHIRGLTLRQTAACYHVIGRMVSGDTGDPYLALSGGAKVVFLMSPELSHTGYRWHNVAYTPRHWQGQPIRARYINHGDRRALSEAASDLSFEW